MYEVVLGIDDDEARGLAQADAIADLPAADSAVHATLLHDFTDNPSGASVPQVTSVRHAKERLEAAGVAVSLAESSGDPAAAILDVAAEHGADLVCVAARKRSPAGKALFGSVTQTVIRNTDRPVLVCSVPGEK